MASDAIERMAKELAAMSAGDAPDVVWPHTTDAGRESFRGDARYLLLAAFAGEIERVRKTHARYARSKDQFTLYMEWERARLALADAVLAAIDDT